MANDYRCSKLANTSNEFEIHKSANEDKRIAADGNEDTLTPFFWLREANDEEDYVSGKPSGQPTADTSEPHFAPCFSEIKDSEDDKSPIKTTATSQLNAVEAFDSEIFEEPCPLLHMEAIWFQQWLSRLEDEVEGKKPLVDGVHFIEDPHVPSLPAGVHLLSKSKILFQRKKLDLTIYTFDDCEELKEPNEDKLGRSQDEDCKATSTRDSFILVLNSRSSSFEERGKSTHNWLMDAHRPIDSVYQPITHRHQHVPDACDRSRPLKRNDPKKLFDPGGASLGGFIALDISLNHGVISIDHGHVLFDPGGTSSGELKISSSCQRKIGKRRVWDHTFPQTEFAKDGLNSRRVLFEERWTDAGAESNEASFSSSTRTLSF